MQFLYLEGSLLDEAELKNETFKHIVKARRAKEGSLVHVRNLKDDYLHTYSIENIQKHSATLKLQNSKLSKNGGANFRLGWAVVDPKTIEKTIPFLNELGVGGIDFVYTDFSQKNFKIDLKRLNRILISSCEQCGRSDLMDFKIYDNLQNYTHENPEAKVVDFGGREFSKDENIKQVLIGCEGGFSESERKIFDKEKILGLNSNLILKSTSAVCGVSAKILL